MAEWDGFIGIPVDCKNCGKRLHGQGSGYPAETYLGTYNGLCYPCTGRPAEVIGRYSDGAVCVEHPPHCPSWRRDRERYFAFEDCTACKGLGSKWVYRADGSGGSYMRQCVPCLDRRYAAYEGYRKRQQEIVEEIAACDKAARKLMKQLKKDWLENWQNGSVAITFRALMKEWWETPVVKEPRPELTLIKKEGAVAA